MYSSTHAQLVFDIKDARYVGGHVTPLRHRLYDALRAEERLIPYKPANPETACLNSLSLSLSLHHSLALRSWSSASSSGGSTCSAQLCEGLLEDTRDHAVPRRKVPRQVGAGRRGRDHLPDHHLRPAVPGLQRGGFPAEALVGLPEERLQGWSGTGRGAAPARNPLLPHQRLGAAGQREQQPAVRRELHGHGVLHDPDAQSAAGGGGAVPHAGGLHGAGEPAGAVRHPALPHPPLQAVLPLHRQPGHRRPAGQRHLRLQLPGLPRVPPQGQSRRLPVQAGRGDGLLHRLGGQPLPHRHRPLRLHPPAAGVPPHRDAHASRDRLLRDVGGVGGHRRAAAAGLELQASELGLLRHLPAHRRELPDVLDRRHQRPPRLHRLRLHVHPVEGAPPRRQDAAQDLAEEPGGPRLRRHQGPGSAARPGPHGHPPGQDAGADPGGAGGLLGAAAGHHGLRPVLEDGRQHQDGVCLLQHALPAQLHRQPHHLRSEEQGPPPGLPDHLPGLPERLHRHPAAGQQPGVGLSEEPAGGGRPRLRQDHCEDSQADHVCLCGDLGRSRVIPPATLSFPGTKRIPGGSWCGKRRAARVARWMEC